MSSRFGQHLRGNVVGYVAVFIALCGTAAALPGKNQVDSGDIKKGQVKAADIGTNAVSGSKVADGSLTGADLADNSVTGQQVNEGTLNLPPSAPSGAAGGDLAGTYPDPTIAPNAVGADEVADATLTAVDIAPNSLGTGAIAEGTLFNDDSLAANDLAPDSVGDSEVATNAIGFLEPTVQPDDAILDGTIDTQDVANNNLTGNDIDESTLGFVPTAENAFAVAGHGISSSSVTVPAGNSTIVFTNPFPIEFTCPGNEAAIRVRNDTGVAVVSFIDKGAAAPEFQTIGAGVGTFSTLQSDAVANTDFWIWHLASQTSGTGEGATFFIGIDETGATDCDFYFRAIFVA